jgi:histidyl-tRNA synthetase
LSRPEKINPVRGTQDFFSTEAQKLRFIEDISWSLAQRFGFEELRTPIFELSQVFHRSLGETSDAVTKETYDFIDRGGDSITLRPEGTAGAVRAALSNNLLVQVPLKVFYSGPMFRHERPQKGRYRQFHQLGVETLGWDEPWADVESIELGFRLLETLGLSSKVKLEINTLGSFENRKKHREALVNFLAPLRTQLSAASKERLEKNPLRILDSKDPQDQALLADAPTLKAFLSREDLEFYQKVLEGLSALGIAFIENPRLVRGFDYYTHTVFEFTTEFLGAQSAVVAGGRYNGLVELLGGPATSGVGWAAGYERLALLLEDKSLPKAKPPVVVLPMDHQCTVKALELCWQIRSTGLSAHLLTTGKLQKRLQRANKLNAQFCVILGPDELAKNEATLKDLRIGTQSQLSLDAVESFFLDLFRKP